MLVSYFVIPLLSAAAGYMASWLFCRFYLTDSRKKKYLAAASKVFSSNLVSYINVEKLVHNNEGYTRLVPMIEQHIDEFLKVKLVKELPYVGMLVGEKTTDALKKIFMKELEILFPQVAAAYAGNMIKEINLASLVSDALQRIPAATLQDLYRRPMQTFCLWGCLLGLITGIVQLVFLSILA